MVPAQVVETAFLHYWKEGFCTKVYLNMLQDFVDDLLQRYWRKEAIINQIFNGDKKEKFFTTISWTILLPYIISWKKQCCTLSTPYLHKYLTNL